jgi:hypothetical protein
LFLRSVTVLREKIADFQTYPFTVPAIRELEFLHFDSPVIFFVGENDSGKSTLLEAIAYQCGFNTAGGGRNNAHEVDSAHAALGDFIRLSWMPKVAQGFFLRAESFYHFASHLDQLAKEDPVELFAIDLLAPGITVFGLSFISLFSGMLIAKDRSSSFVLHLFTSPLTSSNFIFGYTLSLLPMAILQIAVCFIVAYFLGLTVSLNVLLTIVVLIPGAVLFPRLIFVPRLKSCRGRKGI